MLHDGCVGVPFAHATSPLATPTSAPIRTSTTGGAAAKALPVPLPPPGALPPGNVRAPHPPSAAPLPPPSLPPPHGGADGGDGGRRGDDHRGDGCALPVLSTATLSPGGLPAGRVGLAPTRSPRGGGGSIAMVPPSAPLPRPPPGSGGQAWTGNGSGRGGHDHDRSGGRGRGRGRGPADDVTALSRRLSRLLRHDLLAAGLVPAPDGYVPLEAVLRCRGFAGVTVDAVCACVASSEKQRFSLVRRSLPAGDHAPAGGAHTDSASAVPVDGAISSGADGPAGGPAGDGELHIRANQGFSATVAASLSPDAVYTRLVPPPPGSPPLLGVHATTPAAFARIAADAGLRAMRRDAIHFSRLPPTPPPPPLPPPSPSPARTAAAAASAPEPPAAPPPPRAELAVLRRVVAGVRSGRTRGGCLVDSIALVVDVGASAAAGVVWHVSSNGVLLTQGGAGGVLAKRWVLRVTDVESGADRTAELWAAPTGGVGGKA